MINFLTSLRLISSMAALMMAKKKVITRKLAAIEDLGNMDVLCTDKTGTLTEGKIALKDYWEQQEKTVLVLSFFAIWCQPCKEDLRYLQTVQNQFDTTGRLIILSNSPINCIIYSINYITMLDFYA
jgi:magnesium-transporting ATPase (P-type)